MAKKQEIQNVQVIPVQDGVWAVPSATKRGVTYQVQLIDGELECNCMAGLNGKNCYHKKAVRTVSRVKEEVSAKSAGKSQKPKKGVTISGYQFDQVTSAFHKEVRQGNEEAALFWGLQLYETAGYYFWKRALIQSIEDIGLASPETIQQVTALAQNWEFCKKTSWYVDPQSVIMAVILLCRAPKSTEVDDAKNLMLARRKAGQKLEVPGYALDCHTKFGKAAGRTEADWYQEREGMIGPNPYRDKLRQEFHAKFVQQATMEEMEQAEKDISELWPKA